MIVPDDAPPETNQPVRDDPDMWPPDAVAVSIAEDVRREHHGRAITKTDVGNSDVIAGLHVLHGDELISRRRITYWSAQDRFD
jgi:hypothetical protein